MRFFERCKTIDEVKATYKQLAKKFHPDHGGDTAIMQHLNTEYACACTKIYEGDNLTEEETAERVKLSEEYRKVIEQIINLPSIFVELVGNWIWVTGNTYSVKSSLKQAGLFFASKKIAWYYRSPEYKTKRGKKSLEEMRSKYGSEKISIKQKKSVSIIMGIETRKH